MGAAIYTESVVSRPYGEERKLVCQNDTGPLCATIPSIVYILQIYLSHKKCAKMNSLCSGVCDLLGT